MIEDDAAFDGLGSVAHEHRRKMPPRKVQDDRSVVLIGRVFVLIGRVFGLIGGRVFVLRGGRRIGACVFSFESAAWDACGGGV